MISNNATVTRRAVLNMIELLKINSSMEETVDELAFSDARQPSNALVLRLFLDTESFGGGRKRENDISVEESTTSCAS